MQYHEDDRAQRLMDVFEKMEGQINISYVNSTKHIVAWHMHNIQTDYWICLKGSFFFLSLILSISFLNSKSFNHL